MSALALPPGLLAQAVRADGNLLVAQNIAFGIIAAVMLVCAWRVVTTGNVVRAAIYLVIVLAGVAAQFILLGAEFVGVTQVLVYIGAIVVLFLFGIMLTRAKLGHDDSVASERRFMAALVGVMLFAVMGYAVVDRFRDVQVGVANPRTTAQISDAIFSTYLVPFEAVSVLLLAALIGAIVLARKD
jgi:NADH-quinone oxidoreductase subunit J